MTEFLAGLKGYRTILVNAVFALVGVLIALGILPASEAMGVTQEMIANNVDTLIGGLGVAAAAINVVLRLVTSTPAGSKKVSG
jgi:hypothetical protein